MRVFLDANILFSAAKSDGAVRLLLRLLGDAGHECWADGYVIEEARRNLSLKAPGSESALQAVLERTKVSDLHPAGPAAEALRALPEKDRPVLAAAVRSRCAALLTGDRTHFGLWFGKKLAGVAIHSPQTLAKALLQ